MLGNKLDLSSKGFIGAESPGPIYNIIKSDRFNSRKNPEVKFGTGVKIDRTKEKYRESFIPGPG
jgi:hypothetical protein